MMQFKRNAEDGSTVILAVDESLNEEAGELVGQLEPLLDQGARLLIVDGSRMEHMSSGGMRALIRLHHRIRKRGGEMVLAALHPLPTQALQMTRLDHVFSIYGTIPEALEAFRNS